VALLIWEFTRPVCPKILLEGEQAPPSNALYSLSYSASAVMPRGRLGGHDGGDGHGRAESFTADIAQDNENLAVLAWQDTIEIPPTCVAGL
jgi:hypothetical protein